MSISKIGVVGAGQMGGGIAQVAAHSGFDVILSDIDMSYVDGAIKRMEKYFDKRIEKGKASEDDKQQTLNRITKTTDNSDFKDVDLVIEVVIEEMEIKKKVFQEIENVCKPEAYFATNTSSMSITEIAASTNRPERFAGMHFFNPPPVMKLVEVIRGYYTSDETVNAIFDVASKMGKTTVEVKKDSPGFIVNRLMMAQYLEAIRLVEEGVASIEDIDIATKLGLNHPMGAFELHDFTGVDIGYYVAEYFCEEFKDMRWNPPQALKELMRAGRLGRKSGAGWYDYSQ